MNKHNDQLNRIKKITQVFEGQPGPLLETLLAVQSSEGYIDEAWVPVIAEALNVSRAEVHGVISFYHDLKTQPPAEHEIKICRAEACQAMGSRALEKQLKETTGLSIGEQSQNKKLEIQPVYCFGNCACAPSVQVDNTLYGRVDANKLARMLEEIDCDKPLTQSVSLINL